MVRHKTASIGYEPQGKERWASSARDRFKKRSPNEQGPEAWPMVSFTQRPRWQCAPIGPVSALWAYFSPFSWEFLAALPLHSRLWRALRDLSPTSAVPSTFHNANGSKRATDFLSRIPERVENPDRCPNHAISDGGDSLARRLISRNSGVPARTHHSNIADSAVVNTAPHNSIRRKAVR